MSDAKNELEKYVWHYERYQNHLNANKHALKSVPKFEEIIDRLNSEKGYPISELEFLKEGLSEVIKCWTILANTYAYGYYLDAGVNK